jgi:hypothetical protein
LFLYKKVWPVCEKCLSLQLEKETKEMEEDILKDFALCAELSDEEIKQIRDGRLTEFSVVINEENQYRLLKNVDGHVVMTVDKMPRTDHSCFYYNDGIFPYVVKDSLKFIGLNGEHETCFTKIIGIEAVPGTRFHYQGPDMPIIEDPNGDSCMWELYFEVVPMMKDFKVYLMRWDAADDSFTDKDLEMYIEDMKQGMFQMDWTITDWKKARRGDVFYMLRTGGNQAGIVFNGQFISDPYPVNSLSGKHDHEMCVDMVCINVVKPGEAPRLSLKELQEAIPEFNWEKGPSGVLLSKKVAQKLASLWIPDLDELDNLNDFDIDNLDLEDFNLDDKYLN